MLKRFMQDAQSFLIDAPENQWEWLFLAQHHGVPTRLLDWSENALVALFFACQPVEPQLAGGTRPNGDVWVMLPTALNDATETWRKRHEEDLPLFGVDKFLDRYHPLADDSQEPRRPVAALASRTFRRISHQWGTFTVTDSEMPLEAHQLAGKFLHRIRIGGDAKGDILEELRSLGIEDRFVYPDLHRLGTRVKELFA